MKKLLFLLAFSAVGVNAQNLVEDNDITENRRELGRQNISYNLDNPTEFYRLKCDDPVYAQIPGGEKDFKQKLMQNMNSLVDGEFYSVNGTFDLILYLNKSGNLERFDLRPEVQNSNLLSRDLGLALKKMNLKFTPASCGGVPVESRLRQKINFRTEGYDL